MKSSKTPITKQCPLKLTLFLPSNAANTFQFPHHTRKRTRHLWRKSRNPLPTITFPLVHNKSTRRRESPWLKHPTSPSILPFRCGNTRHTHGTSHHQKLLILIHASGLRAANLDFPQNHPPKHGFSLIHLHGREKSPRGNANCRLCVVPQIHENSATLSMNGRFSVYIYNSITLGSWLWYFIFVVVFHLY